ncbi:MAG TPA: malonyl-CoA decarboxylase [Kiloniellales bacterium]|nr:malonyl-CoA decarboxylase [Kiloniellales bacterium]
MTEPMESVEQRESFFERTLGNLTAVWRDIAQGAARTVGLNDRALSAGHPAALEALMRECLEARGGEVSARMRAAGLGRAYLELDAEGRRRFHEILAERFGVEAEALDEAIEGYRQAADPEASLTALQRLRAAVVPQRVKLIRQFNALPEGVKFLVDLRADLLALPDRTPALDGLDADLRELLSSWFDTGFLDLSQITWDSPASLLEKLIAYEAVHEIRSWNDLRHRVQSNRQLYALFHPRMPDEPLAFIEVALVKGIARNIQRLLDPEASKANAGEADTAIFYSISNTQKGLRGVSFGDYLIKRVVQKLAAEQPRLKVFSTLSPVPGFRKWLANRPAELVAAAMTETERGRVCSLGEREEPAAALEAILDRPGWHEDADLQRLLEQPMLKLCARYLRETRPDGTPIDPVARFHLQNGARLEHINWLGDTSAQGLQRSAGLMVNYRYILEDIEKNHEAYMRDGKVAMSSEVRSLVKAMADAENGTRRKLRLG